MGNRITSDEDRLVNQHESAKAAVEHDLSSEVSLRAEREAHKDTATLEDIAEDVKDKAVSEVREAPRVAAKRQRLARAVQVVDFLFYIVYTLLGTRLVLEMMAANDESGFVQLVRNVTDPFYSMFQGVVRETTVEGGYTFAFPILVAIGAYALLHWGVRSLARLVAYRSSEI
jgi:hypothetical protein